MEIIKENQLQKITYVKEFTSGYELNEDADLLLNTMRVFAVKNGYHYEVDFRITSCMGERWVEPEYDKECEYFLLTCEKYVMCKMVKITAEEIVDVEISEHDGSYIFTLEEW